MAKLFNLQNYSFILGFVTAIQIIAAKVPILKFVDRISGIEVTLNVNKLVSIRNTHLVHDYTECKSIFVSIQLRIIETNTHMISGLETSASGYGDQGLGQ